ncbi:MAG: diguanylate cyclase [Solirubrobacteraceae bacterium]|nr:diguanylate cyclase [Solirubrobacteraceae bacterium]
MSFRGRLTVFVLLIVLVPMLAVGFALSRLVASGERGKADVRLATSRQVAVNLADQARLQGADIAERIARDPALLRALRRGDHELAQIRLRRWLRETPASRIVLRRLGEPLADAGQSEAIFPEIRQLATADGVLRGELMVAVAVASSFAGSVERVTGNPSIVAIDGWLAGSTVGEIRPRVLGSALSEVTADGVDYRVAGFASTSFPDASSRTFVLEPRSVLAAAQRRGRVLIAAVLGGFLLAMLAVAFLVAHSLHRQIARVLEAARRIGGGDYSARIPTEGRDDFAALGEEFNKMVARLEGRETDLLVERERLRVALVRIGDALGASLDRDALLEVVVAAARDGVGADVGRASVCPPGGSWRVVARSGEEGVGEGALRAVEHRAARTGHAAEAHDGTRRALARPLKDSQGSVVALIAIARAGSGFTTSERKLFSHLAGQAARSISNVESHRAATAQALTDPLTGLANRRAFGERLTLEVDRVSRFPDQALSLLMLDIDDFKLVNDTLGHQVGDKVLCEVAKILRRGARDVDLPVRYGGEEYALIVPGADIEGAVRVAERIRERVASLAMPVRGELDGPVRITLSIGVAQLRPGAPDAASLVAAADGALYRAKRAGKNRVERAPTAIGVPAE